MTTSLQKKKKTPVKQFSYSVSNSPKSYSEGIDNDNDNENDNDNDNEENNSLSNNNNNNNTSTNNLFIKQKRQRQENSLGELTKSFIEYVINCKMDKININDLVKGLKVKKRRIYDITNVLEGIGYIKKIGKNEISWIKKEAILQFDQRLKQQSQTSNDDKVNELNVLMKENEKLDSYLQSVQKEIQTLSEQPDWKTYGYVTFEDINTLTKDDKMKLIAVKAPPDTLIDIPDKAETIKIKTQLENEANQKNEPIDNQLMDSISKEYQIYLESPNGEINVYLILNNTNSNSNHNNNASNSISNNCNDILDLH